MRTAIQSVRKKGEGSRGSPEITRGTALPAFFIPGEERKNYVLHFQTCRLLHPTLRLRSLFSKICNNCPCESHHPKQAKTGGSDPLFGGRSAQSSVGSLPPS